MLWTSPQVLAELCQSGYKDALRFLQENSEYCDGCAATLAFTFTLSVPVSLMPCFPMSDLIMQERLTPGPTPLEDPPTCCCEHRETTKEWLLRRLRLLRKQHWWLDKQIVLPTPIKKGVMSCHTVVIMNFSFSQGMLKLVNCWYTYSWTKFFWGGFPFQVFSFGCFLDGHVKYVPRICWTLHLACQVTCTCHTAEFYLFFVVLAVFCEACQDKSGLYAKMSEMLPMKVASYMLLPYTLPVQSAYSVAQRWVSIQQ